MESNWRYNVWELGLTDANITLIARRVDLPQPPYEWIGQLSDGTGVTLESSLLTDVPVVVGILPYDPAHPSYPYGWNVEPD